jgi:hypothetical protein
MTNNLNLREYSENNGIIEDYPYRELVGDVVINGKLTGSAIRKLFNIQRWVSGFINVPANTLTYPAFVVSSVDNSHWFEPNLITIDNSGIPFTFVVPYSGLYWIHWMTNIQNAISNNSEYFSELWYVPQNLIGFQTVASSGNVNRTGNNNAGPVNSNCWMRYLTAGDAFTFRVSNTEANLISLTWNATYLRLD